MIRGLDEIAAMEFGRRRGRGGLGIYMGPPLLPDLLPGAMSSDQLIFGSGAGMDFSSLRPSLPSQASNASGASRGPAGMTFSAKGVGLPSLSFPGYDTTRGPAGMTFSAKGVGLPSLSPPGYDTTRGPAGMTFSAKGVGLPSLSYGAAPGDWRGAARQAGGFGGTGRPGAGSQYRPGGQSMLPPLGSGGFGGAGRPGKVPMEPSRGVYPAMSAGAPMTTPAFTGSGPMLIGSGAFATGGPMLFGKGAFATGGPMMLGSLAGLCSPEEIGAMEFGRR